MRPDIRKFRVSRPGDVLLRHIERKHEFSQFIITQENPEENSFQMFKVEAIGADVKDVSVGDYVLGDWRRITEPFKLDLDGKAVSCGITDFKELVAVYEGVNENEL